MASAEQKQDDNEKEHNIFRDSPLRYLGYTNEVGESFRYQFPKFVKPSYFIAFSYCVMDAATTGYHTWSTYDSPSPSSSSFISQQSSREKAAFVATADTLLWQSKFVVVN